MEVQGTGISQKNVMSPCLTQNLGSNMDTSGMLVRVFGRVPTAAGWVEALADTRYPGGAYIVYVDDGSGAADGRDLISGLPVPGIRVLIDANDLEAYVPNFGDYVMLEGIAGYEPATWWTLEPGTPPVPLFHDLGTKVRQIMSPTIEVLATGV